MKKIVHAAFLGKNGHVYDTGPLHDIDQVPSNVEIESDGFVLEDGSYVTREQATEELHADHKVQSEELIKATPAPGLPKLGIENRPQTPSVTPEQASTKQKLMFNAARSKGAKVTLPAIGPNQRLTGLTGPAGGTAISYALQGPNDLGTQRYEDFHQMMNRVEGKHGKSARQNLASNLYSSIPQENREAVRSYVTSLYGTREPPMHRWHEEHLAHLISYLNNPKARRNFHIKHGSWDPNLNSLTPDGQTFNIKMKQALRHFQNASNKADKKWLTQFIHKSEIDAMNKSMEWKPSEQEIELALDMLHAFHDEIPEFKAAKFMADGYQPSQEEIEDALKEHDGDYETAALEAHHLEINDENMRTLRKITYIYIHQDELSKNEQDVSIIPRIVKPYNDEAIKISDLVRKAFETGDVHEIKLHGKHSKGTAIIKDCDTGDLWLLKPGSGTESPALGINEEKAEQSTRECAFNDCARVMGLGQYVPKSALILLDGVKTSALQFFPIEYQPVEKLKKRHLLELREIFQRATVNGLIYKWAVMDFILGQVDRHAGNVLINSGWDVKFIDAGSTFAGPSFSPSTDSKNTFVPYYLRVFSDRKFTVLTPKEKYDLMPTINQQSEDGLKHWIDSLPEGQLVATMNEYGINPEPEINRLRQLRAYPGLKTEFLKKFFSGHEL